MRALHCRLDGGALRPSAGAVRDASRRMDVLLPHHAPVRGALSILGEPGQVNPVGCSCDSTRARGTGRCLQNGQVLTIRGACGDEVGVRETKLARDLAHCVVFRDRDIRVRGSHRHAAVEQRQLLLACCTGRELARDEVVLRTTEERLLPLRDLHDGGRLLRGEATALRPDALHRSRLLGTHSTICAGDASEDVREAGDVARRVRLHALEGGDHAPHGLRLPAGRCVMTQPEKAQQRHGADHAGSRTAWQPLGTRVGSVARGRPSTHQAHSGFFGTPLHGFGIVGWDGGTGCGTDVRACDSACFWRMNPSAEPPGFGVVACLHDQMSWMFAGEDVVKVFPETQLFTDCWAPKIPPASVMSVELGSPAVPLCSNVLPEILLPESWKNTVDGVGGKGSGFSMPSKPTLGLFRIVLFFTRSAYVPVRMMPLPHGIEAVVEFAGVVRLPLFSITFFRMIVHRWMRVLRNAGVAESFRPELQAPSCGGG